MEIQVSCSNDGRPGATPDISDHQAVVAAIKDMQGQCAGEPACEKACGISLKSMKNFDHPESHYAGLRKGKWESCRKEVPGMAVEQPKK